MSAVRITLNITAEAGTDWGRVVAEAARAAVDAVDGEAVALVEASMVDARALSRKQCRRKRDWPVWS